jgi:hypothetical protein
MQGAPGYIDPAHGRMWFAGGSPGGQASYPVHNAHVEQVQAASA